MLNYIKYIFYLFSFVVPRNNNKWLFGSLSIFAENPKYLMLYLKDNHKTYQGKKLNYIWMAKNKREKELAESFGVKSYLRYSLLGIYHSLTAGVYFFSSYVSDIDVWTCGGAVKINLWHGVGIKYIERKITKGAIAKIFNEKKWYRQILYLPIYIKPDGLLSTSPMMNKHFSECFEVEDENIIEGLYPRCSIFQMGKDELKKYIEKYVPKDIKELINYTQNYSKTYVYMPTWRDSDRNFIKLTGIDFEKLNNSLKVNNDLMILKLHPNSRMNVLASSYSNISVVNPKDDIYPLLPYTDCLITDYSSIYYDYILLKDKNVLFFIPDYSLYIEKDRELAFDYDKCTAGTKVYDFDSLINIIEKNNIVFVDQSDIIKMFWGSNNHSLDELYSKILKKIYV